jgi:hypothetical protein
MGKRSSKKQPAAPTVSEALDTAVGILVAAAEAPPPAALVDPATGIYEDARALTLADGMVQRGVVVAPAQKKTIPAGKGSSFSREAVIGRVVANPKKPGTQAAARFAKYKNGMTVAEALAAGLKAKDIRWDQAHKFIQLG